MTQIIENAVCTFCGCLCDDITAEVDNGRIVKAKRCCANGRGTFLNYDPALKNPRVAGEEVSWDHAIAEAAKILNESDSPLIYGLSSTAVEAQSKAVELADRMGAIIDTTSSVCHGPTGLAMQSVGEATATLGEIRNRSDLVICWGCNPAEAHMRHFARYSLMPKSERLPGGRKDRTLVVVDVRKTKTSKMADLFIQVEPGHDYEILTALRALVNQKPVRGDRVGGVSIEQLESLAQSMKTSSFGVVLMGMGLTMTRGRDLCVSELFSLVADLNQFTRFAVAPMRGHSNVAGADQVMTWQTGYPFAVSFAKKYPVYGPGEFTAVDVLAKKEADAAVILSSDPGAHFPESAVASLKQIPSIVLDPEYSLAARMARVYFPTACYGIDAAGTYYRMDNIAIRAKQILPKARPTDKEVFVKIMEAMDLC